MSANAVLEASIAQIVPKSVKEVVFSLAIFWISCLSLFRVEFYLRLYDYILLSKTRQKVLANKLLFSPHLAILLAEMRGLLGMFCLPIRREEVGNHTSRLNYLTH